MDSDSGIGAFYKMVSEILYNIAIEMLLIVRPLGAKHRHYLF